MGFHMITGLTAHYQKAESGKAPLTKGFESIPVIDDLEVGIVPTRSLYQQLQRSSNYRQELQCDKDISPEDISFTVVSDVITSWQIITSMPNWDNVVGDLFLRYIFKIAPATKNLFGFSSDTHYADPKLSSNMKFVTKGVVLIKAIDATVQLLGPDLYPLKEILFDLGKRHVIMRAQPEFWPVVGEALFLVFEERLGHRFQHNFKAAWTVIYNFLGYHMIQGLTHQYKENTEAV
jgi:hemoglobin-like flavoprotein